MCVCVCELRPDRAPPPAAAAGGAALRAAASGGGAASGREKGCAGALGLLNLKTTRRHRGISSPSSVLAGSARTAWP